MSDTVNAGTKAVENVTILEVSGEAPFYIITTDIVSAAEIGDSITDERGVPEQYLIQDGEGTDTLTVMDTFGADSPPDKSGTSQATIIRSYPDIESSVSDGLNFLNRDVISQPFPDSAFDEQVDYIDSDYHSKKIIVPVKHQGNGLPASGVVNSISTALADVWIFQQDGDELIGMETDSNANATGAMVSLSILATDITKILKNLFHGAHGGGGTNGINDTLRATQAINNGFYDIKITTSSPAAIAAIYIDNDQVWTRIQYNSVYNIGTNFDGPARGLAMVVDDANGIMQNNICGGVFSNTGTFVAYDFPGTQALMTITNNIDDDGSLAGIGSANKINQDFTQIFKSIIDGAEDLTLIDDETNPAFKAATPVETAEDVKTDSRDEVTPDCGFYELPRQKKTQLLPARLKEPQVGKHKSICVTHLRKIGKRSGVLQPLK